MKNFVKKKGHFYKGLPKDSYNRNKLMIKNMSDNNLLDTLKKIQKFKMWNLKIENSKYVTFKKLKIENFKNALSHINGV